VAGRRFIVNAGSGPAAVSALDVMVIGIYGTAVLAVGWYLRRRASGSLENFFLAGRRLPGWANGISYAVTSINADVAPAYCAWTVGTGLFVAWLYFSRFGVALMIGAMLFAFFWRRLGFFTSPEFYELRFSGRTGRILRSWIAIRSAFIAIVAWTGAGLIGIHKVAGPTLGWTKEETMLIVVPVLLIYVIMSGYIGVVATDVFQSGLIVAGSLVLCFAVLNDVGGPIALLERLTESIGTEVVSNVPPVHHAELGLVAIFAWVVGTSVGYGGDAAPMAGAMEGQRVLSCRNTREASKMYITAELALFFMLLVITLPALGALARDPALAVAPRAERELVYGRLLSEYMPPGLLGLQIAALLAAVMSTVSSNLNFGAQVVTSDLYRRYLQPDKSEQHYIGVGRIIMLLIMGLGLLVAWQAESLITIAVFMLGLSSAEYTANWAQWWWWRFNKWGRLSASFGGPIVFMFVKCVLFPDAGEYEHVLLGIGLTTLLWLVVTMVTPPDDKETLAGFYRRARPLGRWRPVQLDNGSSFEDSWKIIAQGFGLALLGVSWIGCGILGLSDFYIGRYHLGTLLMALSGAGGILFFNLYKRYISSLEILRGAEL
jgi:SSS family solute:Na+ symporter